MKVFPDRGVLKDPPGLNSRRFSVIVPTFKRPALLRRCIRAVTELDYPAECFEIVIVNDDIVPIDQIVEPFRSRLNLQLLNQKNTGPAQARNYGAAVSTGEFLIFLDDDCAPAADWLMQWDRSVSRWPDNALGGGTRNAVLSNLFSLASQSLLDYLYLYYNCSSGLQHGRQPFAASNNFCVPAAGFRKVGGFSPDFPIAAAEDRDFCDNWLYNGFNIRMAEEAVVYHSHELSCGSFWRQHFQYGRGAALYHMKRTVRRGSQLKIEPFAFYGGLVLFPFRSEGVARACALSCLLILAQLANMAGFIAGMYGESSRRHVSRPPAAPTRSTMSG